VFRILGDGGMLTALSAALMLFWCALPLILWGVSEVLGPAKRGLRLRNMANDALSLMPIGLIFGRYAHQPTWLQAVNLLILVSPAAVFALFFLDRPRAARLALLGTVSAVLASCACRWRATPAVWVAAFAGSVLLFACIKICMSHLARSRMQEGATP
jgi:hypothetical protein